MKSIIFPLKKGFPDILQAIILLLVSPSLSPAFCESTPSHHPFLLLWSCPSNSLHLYPCDSFNSWIKHELINPGENPGCSHSICLRLDCLTSKKLAFVVQNSVSQHAWSLTNVCFSMLGLEAWDRFFQPCSLLGSRMGRTHLLSPHIWHLMWNIILWKLSRMVHKNPFSSKGYKFKRDAGLISHEVGVPAFIFL